MQRKILQYGFLAMVLGLGGGLAACDKQDDPGERAVENIKDGLDIRDNEKLKDAGEDAKDAVKDAGDAMNDKAEELKNSAKDGSNTAN